MIEGVPIVTSISVADSDDVIVLLDYMGGPKNFRNVLRVARSGDIVWRAELPDRSGPEAYVSLELGSDGLVGYSWSGYSVVLEVDSGRITRSEFVK
jgi:hypothetical protein